MICIPVTESELNITQHAAFFCLCYRVINVSMRAELFTSGTRNRNWNLNYDVSQLLTKLNSKATLLSFKYLNGVSQLYVIYTDTSMDSSLTVKVSLQN